MIHQAPIAPDPSPTRYAAGALLGNKYLLEHPLGEGGMGTVWRARNLALGIPVALKVLQPEVRTQEAVDRLLREARIEAELRHPGIVRVFDFEQTECGDFFIVMELLEGETLAGLLERHGKVDATEAVRLLLPLVDALCAVHLNGVVHRDLKPANIVLASVGHCVRPTLVDFGIAQWAQPDAAVKLTGAGTVLGSPAYMAPEQARGLTVDHRADIWGVCVILYEAVSGREPFEGQSYNAILRAVVEDEVKPFEETAAKHHALWAIVERGLAKDPALRFGGMHELGTALARWLLAHGGLDDPTKNEIARKWLGASEWRPNHTDAGPAVSAFAATEAGSIGRPASREHGRGAALLARAVIVALVFFADVSVGNRETEPRPAANARSSMIRGQQPSVSVLRSLSPSDAHFRDANNSIKAPESTGFTR